MSNVKIKANASGTADFTIQAPATDSAKTLTLPADAGAILTDASSLPAANLTGTLPALDGSSLTGIEGVPSGVICMWGGLVANIPSGWNLCDGNNGTPDLSGKFIKGTTSDAGGTGGSTTTGATTLSTSQMPLHGHPYRQAKQSSISNDASGGAIMTDYNGSHRNVAAYSGTPANSYYAAIGGEGGGGSHTHTFEPSYYELCYIQKT